jgi:hypothetical protein
VAKAIEENDGPLVNDNDALLGPVGTKGRSREQSLKLLLAFKEKYTTAI